MFIADLRILISVLVAILLPLAVGVALWRVLRQARTPQGSVAWVVFLLAAPWFALPSYLLFGHHKLHGYTKRRRASHQLMKTYGAYARTVQPSRDRAAYRLYESISELKVVGGNRFELLIDGAQTFPAIHDAIDAAESYVLVQYYTIADDDTGRHLRQGNARNQVFPGCLHPDHQQGPVRRTGLHDHEDPVVQRGHAGHGHCQKELQ